MIKLIGTLLTLCLLTSGAAQAEEWVFCDACDVAADFNAAAVAEASNVSGYQEFWVGNTISFKLYRVQTYTSLDNEAPASGGGGTPVTSIVSSYRETAATEEHFGELITLIKVEVEDRGRPTVLPIKQDGFGSFAGRDHSLLSDYLWSRWGHLYQRPQSNIPQAALEKLFQAVFGVAKFQVCLIFQNGDLACFYLPATEDAEAEYVDGTARDKDNVPIGTTGGTGGRYHTVPVTPTNTRYGPIGYASDGYLYLSCTFVNGKLVECTVTWLPN
ncbi:MAG TPA: hypothetical protein VMR06_08620 [Dokdonella sp.]|uniref:hypothetical protein n=1 Tax=Dokdonella sp. TaxID=2291710 RepID=UPI002CD22BA5|nr:hypothetical protein [Dokdonella sp.]HUD42045.1 hypothetical protein [Dokdonella sp.]